LLLLQILPVFSVVAPCPRGASPVSVRRQTFTTGCQTQSLPSPPEFTMFDLSFTKEQMLNEIKASHRAFVNRFSDPASPALVSLDEASLVIRGTTPDQLWCILNDVLSKRFAQVRAEQLFSDLMYPVKKGLGNAHKWGNERDIGKEITVETVITRTGAVVSISDEGRGFDPVAILSKVRRAEHYFTHGGSGFHHFAKTQSLISYTNGGRTLLVCYRAMSDSGAAGVHAADIETQTRLATATRLARAKVCLVSYPMSGCTWLRALIGKALCERYGLDEGLIFHESRLTKAAGVLRILCTHGDADFIQAKHYRDLETNLTRYQSKRVILLVRNPRDVVVSCYGHAIGPTGAYSRSLSDFVRDDCYGIRKIVTFYNIWYANRHVPEAFLPIRYDALHTHPGRTLRRALSLIDAQPYSDEIINRAVHYGSGDHVNEMEGGVARYADDLKQEDQDYVNSVLEELGCPDGPLIPGAT
jgi:hypothetical protein